jgi:NAD(P)H-hydrate epimerase
MMVHEFSSNTRENHPDLWRAKLPVKKSGGHKYDCGHAVIYGAPELTGATRLAAESCARAGAGLVTVLSPPGVVNVYRETLAPHIMVRDDPDWHDDRVTARLYGPGGLCAPPDFSSALPTVLDADALKDLPKKLSANFVLTPHEGEFKRAFPDLEGPKQARAQAAARQSGACVVLKGPDTVIAAPPEPARAQAGDRVVINTHAGPELATAGTGDVLAGLITGLLAQGMPVFEAACAGVWIHGEAGRRFGAGLVAADLPGLIPAVLQDLA